MIPTTWAFVTFAIVLYLLFLFSLAGACISTIHFCSFCCMRLRQAVCTQLRCAQTRPFLYRWARIGCFWLLCMIPSILFCWSWNIRLSQCILLSGFFLRGREAAYILYYEFRALTIPIVVRFSHRLNLNRLYGIRPPTFSAPMLSKNNHDSMTIEHKDQTKRSWEITRQTRRQNPSLHAGYGMHHGLIKAQSALAFPYHRSRLDGCHPPLGPDPWVKLSQDRPRGISTYFSLPNRIIWLQVPILSTEPTFFFSTPLFSSPFVSLPKSRLPSC